MSNELGSLLRLEKLASNVSEETRANRTGILLGAEGRLIKAVPVLADEGGQVLDPRPLNLEQRVPVNVPEEARIDGERKLTELDLEGWGRVAVVGVPLRVSGTDYYALYVFKRIVDFNRGINQGLLAYLVIAAAIALYLVDPGGHCSPQDLPAGHGADPWRPAISPTASWTSAWRWRATGR